MVRSFILGLFVVAASVGMSASSNAAVSRNNPYRDFASGTNYGAQQWERSHTHCARALHVHYGHAHRGY